MNLFTLQNNDLVPNNGRLVGLVSYWPGQMQLPEQEGTP
jgi:hypothetical protein